VPSWCAVAEALRRIGLTTGRDVAHEPRGHSTGIWTLVAIMISPMRFTSTRAIYCVALRSTSNRATRSMQLDA
jgi:Arc/MetJ family transcription regulator